MRQALDEREFRFTRRDFDYLRRLSYAHIGIVASDEKFDLFYARLVRRVRALGLPSFKAYCDYLDSGQDPDETTHLINALTTNLTDFFRENHHFDFLREVAIPTRQQEAEDLHISIWSAGCSTGEEPYSLGMVLGEMEATLRGWQVDILATDIDSNVVAAAARGVYAAERVSRLSQERLKRWFLKGNGSQQGMVRIKPALRQWVEFGEVNLVQPWNQGPKDIIFCRNVLIYFDREAKAGLVDRFADVLKPGGFLFVGHSESLQRLSDRFESVGKTVYRKIR